MGWKCSEQGINKKDKTIEWILHEKIWEVFRMNIHDQINKIIIFKFFILQKKILSDENKTLFVITDNFYFKHSETSSKDIFFINIGFD